MGWVFFKKTQEFANPEVGSFIRLFITLDAAVGFNPMEVYSILFIEIYQECPDCVDHLYVGGWVPFYQLEGCFGVSEDYCIPIVLLEFYESWLDST